MKSIITVLVLVTINFSCFCQNSDSSRNLRFTAFASVGRSVFVSNPSAPSKFPTLEVRIGGGIVKPFLDQFELRSRLTFGVKFKREPFNEPGQPVIIGPPFMDLDEFASARNYYFVEIPLSLQFNLPHPKIGFSLGLNYRNFFPDNESVNSSPRRHEVGILPGFSFRLNEKADIGFDYYFGLTRVYSSEGLIDNQEFTMDAWNQFAQIRFEYYLTRKGVK